MIDDLPGFHDKVNSVIYNPFINLKTLANDLKKSLGDQEKYKDQISRLNSAISALDEFENLPHGNLERIKGFNKTKSQILKLIKEIHTLN